MSAGAPRSARGRWARGRKLTCRSLRSLACLPRRSSGESPTAKIVSRCGKLRASRDMKKRSMVDSA
eukprot:8433508-Pyramimonas_sp.AAC.1